MLKYNHNKKKGKMKMKTYVAILVDTFNNSIKSDIIYSDKTKLEVLQEYLLTQGNNAENLTEKEENFLCDIIEVPKK